MHHHNPRYLTGIAVSPARHDGEAVAGPVGENGFLAYKIANDQADKQACLLSLGQPSSRYTLESRR
nr:hypothetical protein GCM10020063_009200 [Dactylosporangium thailandense]